MVHHLPGHTDDSVSLWLKEEDALFVGDSVLGQGSSVFSDLKAYMETLHRLQVRSVGREVERVGRKEAKTEAHVHSSPASATHTQTLRSLDVFFFHSPPPRFCTFPGRR